MSPGMPFADIRGHDPWGASAARRSSAMSIFLICSIARMARPERSGSGSLSSSISAVELLPIEHELHGHRAPRCAGTSLAVARDAPNPRLAGPAELREHRDVVARLPPPPACRTTGTG